MEDVVGKIVVSVASTIILAALTLFFDRYVT
jgi:hypothetical protein